MPVLDDIAIRADAPPAADRWDRELGHVDWIELPDRMISVEGVVWVVLAIFAATVFAAIL